MRKGIQGVQRMTNPYNNNESLADMKQAQRVRRNGGQITPIVSCNIPF